MLPRPGPVLSQFRDDLLDGVLIEAAAMTMQRASIGAALPGLVAAPP